MKTLLSCVAASSLLFAAFVWATPLNHAQLQDDLSTPQTQSDSNTNSKVATNKNRFLRIQHEGLASRDVAYDIGVTALVQTLKADLATLTAKNPAKPLDFYSTIEMISDADEFELVRVHTKVDATGKGVSTFSVPKAPKLKEYRQMHLSWDTLKGEFTFDKNFSDLKGDVYFKNMYIGGFKMGMPKLSMAIKSGHMQIGFDDKLIPTFISHFPHLTMHDDEKEVKATGIEADIRLEKSPSGIDLKIGSVQIDKLVLTHQIHDLVMQAEGLFVDVDAKETHEQTLDYIAKIQLKKFSFVDEAIRFDISYSSNFLLQHLDVATLLQWQEAVYEMQQQYQQGDINEAQIEQAVLTHMMNIFPNFLAKSPEFGLENLKVGTEKGHLNGNVTIKIDGNSPVSMENPLMLLGILDVKADMVADKSFLIEILSLGEKHEMLASNMDNPLSEEEKAEAIEHIELMAQQQLDMLSAKKFLVEEGETMKADLTFKQSQLMLNGKVIPLPF